MLHNGNRNLNPPLSCCLNTLLCLSAPIPTLGWVRRSPDALSDPGPGERIAQQAQLVVDTRNVLLRNQKIRVIRGYKAVVAKIEPPISQIHTD